MFITCYILDLYNKKKYEKNLNKFTIGSLSRTNYPHFPTFWHRVDVDIVNKFTLFVFSIGYKFIILMCPLIYL